MEKERKLLEKLVRVRRKKAYNDDARKRKHSSDDEEKEPFVDYIRHTGPGE